MKQARPPLTREQLDAIRKKISDPNYLKDATERVAEKLLSELFPQDNEARLVETHDSYRKGGAE